jgi:hypothetical protein
MASERGDASGVPKMITDMARGDAALPSPPCSRCRLPPQLVGLGGLGLALTVFCLRGRQSTTEEAALAKATSVLPEFP